MARFAIMRMPKNAYSNIQMVIVLINAIFKNQSKQTDVITDKTPITTTKTIEHIIALHKVVSGLVNGRSHTYLRTSSSVFETCVYWALINFYKE
jgi:hypothetical protein